MSAWSNFLGAVAAFPRRLARALFSPAPDEPGEKRGGRWAGLGFRVTFSLGVLSIFVYAAQENRLTFLKIASLGLLIALAGLLTGAFLGFLFGIPRTFQQLLPAKSRDLEQDSSVGTSEGTQPEYRGNTNLEQISDWLTKILVGLTLIQFREIQSFIGHLVIYLSRGLGANGEQHKSFVLALIILFPIAGFFLGYLLTRLYLPLALRKTDRELSTMVAKLQKVDKEVVDVLSRGVHYPEPEMDTRLYEGLREQIRVLAREYERVRSTIPPGNDRTRSMELIASQMRALANIATPLLPDLMRSDSPGERLAAITCLQVHPSRESFDWLSDRVASEKPFIGYHAAIALLYAVRSGFGSEALKAVRRAKRSLGPELAETDRAKILDKASESVE
ncbi:MAG TPA: hypothetical protein VGS07_02040 [Thermoanaerobaculia bacterium]|jgi:hypothetical protein|nr:hypothetical protein [Thermoanaerobaculia bacterium]